MNSKEFLNRLFETGNVSDEELIKYLIKNYFRKGLTIKDFHRDLRDKHNKPIEYCDAMYYECLLTMDRFIK